jgi:WD40 repeat protein
MCFVTGLLGEVTSVAFSADSRLLCTGDSGGQLILWGASEGTLKRRFLIGRGKRILSVAFSREGDRVASSALDEGHGRRAPPPPEDEWHSTQLWVIQVWNVETGEVVRTLEQLRTAPTDVEFSPGGRQLSCGDRKDVHIFNVDPSMKLKRFTHTVIRNLKHPKAVSAAAWSPDGSLLASGCEDWALRVWDMQSASQRWLAWGHDGKHGCLCPSQRRGGPPNPACPFQGHRARVCKVMWSADCRTVGSVSDDGAIKLWDVASGVHLSTCLPLYDPRLSSFSLGPDPLAARRLAIAMGFHDRLGAASRIHVLDPAVAQMFLEI